MSIVPVGRRGGGGFPNPFAVDLWEPLEGFGFPFEDDLVSSARFDPFTLDLWNPFDSYPFGGFLAQHQPSSGVQWKETPQCHLFKANLSGVCREEEVQVLVDGQTLQISGDQFLSRFTLPENAKLDHLRAGMEEGVLIVMVPKVDRAKQPDVRVVEIAD